MSMSSILHIALRIVQGKPVHVPAMNKADLSNLLDSVAVLRKELAQ
ncbi:hypothetical protein [Pantoea sp. ACRSB]|nr:hypothetical protein [Pantoea sp. ACRSB]MCG7391231.1 hypothetical protein [Pantoea sp. ACRSB]